MLAPEELAVWSKREHKKSLPLCEVLADRYPLIVFYGDVGTGKTATAEGVASRMAKETGRGGDALQIEHPCARHWTPRRDVEARG